MVTQLLTCWIILKIYSSVESCLRFSLTQVDEINSGTAIHIVCHTQPIPCLLMHWRLLSQCISRHIVDPKSQDIASPGGRFKKAYELLNLRALKFSPLNKIHIFQCMGKIFCVEFQRYPLKFHTKYLTHTLKGTIFIQHWNFKSS